MAMTFEELGSALRTEREKLGFSIDDVAHRLKISARVLRALENADKAALPHSVYVRGFVLSYGKLLELNTDELLLVEELYDASEDPSNSDLHQVKRSSPFTASKLLLLIFICLCIAGGSFAWINRDADLFSKLKKDHLTTAQPAPPVAKQENIETSGNVNEVNNSSQQSVEKDSQNTSKQQEEINTKQPAENTENTNQVENTESNNSNQEQEEVQSPGPAEVEQSEQTQEAAAEALTAEPQDLLTGPHKVIITAIAECWVHSNADNADTRQFSLQAGDTFALTFSDSLTLKLGNAGGVRIRYNGKETPAPGLDGEVKTLTFPPKQS